MDGSRIRRLCLSSSLFGALACQAVAQVPLSPGLQLPSPNTPSGSVGNAQNQADMARLQIYDVPSELIGAVGARLQLAYHTEPRVRVTTDPRTGQLLIMAPESIHREIAAKLRSLTAEARAAGIVNDRGLNVGSVQQQTYALRNLNWREIEDSLQRLAGTRLTITTERDGQVSNFRLANANGMQDVLQVDRRQNQVTLLGNGPSVTGWLQVVYALDVGKTDTVNATHVVPLAPAEPRTIDRAVKLIKATFANFQQKQTDNQQTEARILLPQGATTQPRADNALQPEEPATVLVDPNTLSTESGLFGDVQIEFVEELGLMIIRGSKRDVDRTLQVIEQIKAKSIETQPDIQVYPLKHVNSEAIATLVTNLYTQVLTARQGQVSITALGQPNALLLVGRKEALVAAIALINNLDQPLDPASELRVVHLLHASATDAETTIRDFFVDTPGSGNVVRTALGTRVKLIADYRTNSLIIQASPRDMAEVLKLVDQIDVEGTPAQNEVRVFRLKSAIAEDLQTVLEGVIGGQEPAAQAAGGEATPPSTKLSIVARRGRVDSGILAGVVITADASQNALVVRAPTKSMTLIEELIKELDQLPDAAAQIKVFEVQHSDATALAATLQELFGLQVTAGQSATGGLFGGGNQFQAQGLTTGGEGSLVPLRVSIDTRTNSIIVSGSSSDLEVIEVLLLRLDEEGIETRRTDVIWLRNSNATEVAAALTTFLNTQRQYIQQNLLVGQAISVYEQVEREVFVVAEATTNSLIISATPRFYDTIRKIIERLDRRPPLVAIQVVIAEVTLNDQFELGTELGLQDALLFDRNSATGGTLQSPVFNLGTPLASTIANIQQRQPQNVAGQGLSTFGLGRAGSLGYGGLVLSAASESVGVLFRALQDAGRLQVLNRPQIMTMDNRTASTLVGQLVPRIQGVTQQTFGQTINAVDTEVGLGLSVTPRVNQDGLILMAVQVQRSSVGSTDTGIPVGFGPNGEVIRSPIINSTQAQATISAYSGQTVVFAGLISKTRGSSSRKIPWLGDMPLLGPLFRFETETEQRTELLVVLTPRLIQTDDDYEIIKQVESSRMSWCLADVLNIHGDVGLSGGNGLWGPARGATIYPDLQPTVMDGAEQLQGESILLDGGAPVSPAQPLDYGQPVPAPVTGGPPVSSAPRVLETANQLQPVSYQVPLQLKGVPTVGGYSEQRTNR